MSLSVSGFDSGNVSDSGSINDLAPRFPHTRAQLSLIARQHKPLDTRFDSRVDSCDSDVEGDDAPRVSNSFVNKVVALLDHEHAEELKDLLKETYPMDEDSLEQNVLDLMHKHRDDVAGVPFLFLTPTRRPISRPSSRTSTNSTRLYPARPDTPNSAPPSPLALIFRRPHTPVTSPLATGTNQPSSYMTARSDYSPTSSPVLAHVQATYAHAQFTASLPASPLSSPRLLNAKANEFKPIQRPLSAASSPAGMRAETPSPDLWAHNSPRATSNLAIAAPLVPEQTFIPRAMTPSSSLRSPLRPDDDIDEDDQFNPFATEPKEVPRSYHSAEYDPQWSNSSNSSNSPEDRRYMDQGQFQNSYVESDSSGPSPPEQDTAEMEAEAAAMLTDGMTPFDVLSSVFGSTLAPSELEDALAANGYDFDRAMAWLVDRALPTPNQTRIQPQGARMTLVGRDGQAHGPGMVRGGGRAGYQNVSPPPGRSAPRYVNGRPVQGGNRVCRYFVAGECLRADCRFSHDLERALCRFWLRGTCAKQESCEFLHHLPPNVDLSTLNIAMSRVNLGPVMGPMMPQVHSPPPDEFPALGFDNGKGGRGGYGQYHDPGRTRFAAAVKKPVAPGPQSSQNDDQTLAARREALGYQADSLYHRSAIVAPRPSPRLKLRAPALLPTLPTGAAINKLYMDYRERALRLGAARNACLSRAADAWRRGDGAAAKRFSREGHDMNGRMATQMVEAAGQLVRERAKIAEQAVKARDASWSDDPGDRTARGKFCGANLGVCLGIASKDVAGNGTPEERTESMLDLHGLHANEATEVLEEFLLGLEREHFYGLAYLVVGEEKHVGTQDVARGASRARLATGVREWVHRWGYPWSERDGVICVDPLTHAME